MFLMMVMYAAETPYLWSAVSSASGCISSKAFSQSRNNVYRASPFLSAFSCSLLMMCIGCDVDLLALKPNCVALSLLPSAFSSLVCISLAKSLYAVESRLIGLYISGSVWLPLPL